MKDIPYERASALEMFTLLAGRYVVGWTATEKTLVMRVANHQVSLTLSALDNGHDDRSTETDKETTKATGIKENSLFWVPFFPSYLILHPLPNFFSENPLKVWLECVSASFYYNSEDPYRDQADQQGLEGPSWSGCNNMMGAIEVTPLPHELLSHPL